MTQLAPATAERIARSKAAGRECGDCTLCCKLLGIDTPQLHKPPNGWCSHCTPGKGCNIYQDRPDICRGFACVWLVSLDMGEEWKPTRSRMVIHAGGYVGHLSLNISVDLTTPGRWRQEPYRTGVQQFVLEGLTGGTRYSTYVHFGRQNLLLLPGEEIDVTDRFPAVIPLADGTGWAVECFDSTDDLSQFIDMMKRFYALPTAERDRKFDDINQRIYALRSKKPVTRVTAR